MSLMDKVVRKLALKWLSGRIVRLRKEGGMVLRLLDGNKRLLVVLGFIVSGLVAMLTGQDVSQWLDLMFRALGWQDATLIADAKTLATEIVPLLIAIWAAVSALWKMWKQRKAGATLGEVNSVRGYAKLALAEGEILATDSGPALRDVTH